MSRSLEKTAREFYQQSRELLKRDAAAGLVGAESYLPNNIDRWPSEIRSFWESGETERFVLSGGQGDRLSYLVRREQGVMAWSRPMGSIGMHRLAQQYREARTLVEAGQNRDLRRGFIYTLLLLAAGPWLVALVLLGLLAARVSRPIQELTAGLGQLASGNLSVRIPAGRDDEVGRAIRAFNETAEQLEQSRNRLIYLTQLASWQALARKMAHELKNSLTPIRLTMEEMLARTWDRPPGLSERHASASPSEICPPTDDAHRDFIQHAAQIVVDEVESLERRVRAFSEFAAEPPVRPSALDVNGLVSERVAFLKTAHSEIAYTVRLDRRLPRAYADEDLVKGVLTNLMENAAEAAGKGGRVLTVTLVADGKVAIEVHDSGPGLSEEVRRSLFEPAISFKKRGMGLGLSIARKSALLSGGDILLVKGELGGAGFRVLLPRDAAQQDPHR
jgi:nitrogen fixation/metabolism regulation signal transduction histidine kinase